MAAFSVNGTLNCGKVKLLEHGNTMVNIGAEVADRVVFSADDINWKILSGTANEIRCCNIFQNFYDVVVKTDRAYIATKTIVHILTDNVLVTG